MDLNAAISTVMTPNPLTVGPDSAATDLDTLFKEHRIHHVPVIDDNDNVVGIVSKSDFLYLLRGYTAHQSDRFREAVRLLAENRYRALPVVNDKGNLVGIITTHDIINLVNELA